MKQTLLSLLVTTVLLFQSASLVDALTLDEIGVSSVPAAITSWTYNGTNPVFRGTTDPSATVSVNIDGTAESVVADGSGNWSFMPLTLDTAGSYQVSISSGSELLSVNLTIVTDSAETTTTSTVAATTTTTSTNQPDLPEELPQTGTAQDTILLLLGGLGLMTGGTLFYWKVVPKLLLEEASEPVDSVENHIR